jgi:hypothetical protein
MRRQRLKILPAALLECKCSAKRPLVVMGGGVSVVGECQVIYSNCRQAALGGFPLLASAHMAGVNSGIILLLVAGSRVRTSRR